MALEPFGVLNFLKTLLSLEENSPSSAAKSEDLPSPDVADFSSSSSQKPQTQSKAEENSSAYNAYVLFMEAHDQRAKKTRKP